MIKNFMFVRSRNNPILKPNKNIVWRANKVYNPGALIKNGIYHLYYRAAGRAWITRLGHAVSKNGEEFKSEIHPIFSPEIKIEKNGVEDPRIVKIKNIYYMTYTAFDGIMARLCLATSGDLKTWQRHGEMIPNWDFTKAKGFVVKWGKARLNSIARKKWIKAGGIFPEIINGKYWMLFGDRNIWLANSQDGIRWQPVWQPFIKPRKGNYFDNIHVEMGPPPIKTKEGWLVLYHGINDKIVYRIGFLILDLKNPSKILFRCEKPIFEPEELYELSGIIDILPGGFSAMETMEKTELDAFIQKLKDDNTMPNVIFCCGAVVVNGILRIYYGASDSVICTATAKLDKILDIYKNNL
jgi:predicted GH43/DUF377 family glycosyl hydrolase